MEVRRQLTLFVPEKYAEKIEYVRRTFDPVQSALIRSHVTLCQEDELSEISSVLANIKALKTGNITLHLNQLERFSNDQGLWLSTDHQPDEFHELRRKLLAHSERAISHPRPHITLIHPRNAECTTEQLEKIKQLDFPHSITFERISLIEQHGNNKWNIINEFPL